LEFKLLFLQLNIQVFIGIALVLSPIVVAMKMQRMKKMTITRAIKTVYPNLYQYQIEMMIMMMNRKQRKMMKIVAKKILQRKRKKQEIQTTGKSQQQSEQCNTQEFQFRRQI
jgi:hypothetical protein